MNRSRARSRGPGRHRFSAAEAGAVIVDGDGNTYDYVTIGTQQWLTRNLDTTKYIDGSDIPNLTENEYTDWFLSSLDELTAIYSVLHLSGIGDYATGALFWSSSENTATHVYAVQFSDGSPLSLYKANSYSYIPVRNFISTKIYALRDFGQAGYIFNIEDLGGGSFSYLEAYPNFQYSPFAVKWSNIFDQLAGTSTNIGTGQANTTAIIAQIGHTSSTANLCDGLSLGGWINDTSGAYCWYDNDIGYKNPYGALYNWYAVKTGILTPIGWRVPSKADLTQLVTFLGGNTVAGGKLKEIGLTHWTTPNTGATDEYGFRALGCGIRQVDGIFANIGTVNQLYSTTSVDPTHVDMIQIVNNSIISLQATIYRRNGISVRCVRDV